jgi:hypothetical protein
LGNLAYEVAKTLGDTIETIEKHDAPFTKELRDRVRRIMANGEGLEKGTRFGYSQVGPKRK